MIQDVFTPIPGGATRFEGYFEPVIQHSITHWNKGVVPYAAFVEFFRTGRNFFAQGEMWGKAVRSACMFYRYTRDPELKRILRATVGDLLTTQRENGSISCAEISAQPDGPGGDLWERKYVLLGLDEYYEQVESDPRVLQAMIAAADCILEQIGPPPRTRIVDQGWSPNHVESSTILEPIMRLHRRTQDARYLDFARYIVEVEGGANGYNLVQQALDRIDPVNMGGPYPKAYEMMSFFEGIVEYYRATGDERWKTAVLNFYDKVREKEITIIGNGGGDQPYHPAVCGEGWDNTALEQTNPAIERMMETCTGITWLKLCSQILRLTGDPSAADEIEKYAYNGLLGAMKPEGDGFSYVNLLNGVKTNPSGWGGNVAGVYATCCNLNGPMGLAYLPFVNVMNAAEGPVIQLYNAGSFTAAAPSGAAVQLLIDTDFPLNGSIEIRVQLQATETFTIKLRIPYWSELTQLSINGVPQAVSPGTYASLERFWSSGDCIRLELDMRCRVLPAPLGSTPGSDRYVALARGPVVLARDENLDAAFDQPVALLAHAGFVEAHAETPHLATTRMQFRIPTTDGHISMVDYASVDSWKGKKVCTWLPTKSL